MDSGTFTPGEHTLLEGVFLFQDLPASLLERALCDVRSHLGVFARGDVLYAPHAFSRSLGILLSGTVLVTKETLSVSVLAAGDLFGAAALFNDRAEYATTLTARTDCRVLFFPQPLVEDLMAESPALAQNYIRYLSGRIRFLDAKLEGLLAGSAERRLAQYLLNRDQAPVPGDSTSGLAKRLGVSRASLYRALDALTQSGAIRREGRIIHILDENKLQSV